MSETSQPAVSLPYLRRRRKITLAVLAALLAADAAVVVFHWPYAERRVAGGLERGTGCELRFHSYRRTWFPHPGGVFDRVVFARGAAQLAALTSLKVEGSWSDVLTLRHRIDRMRLEGLHVFIPQNVPPRVRRDNDEPETIVGQVIADGALLDVVREKTTLRFEFPRLHVTDAAKSRRLGYRVTARIPEPPGNVTAHGSFGPWKAGATPISGSFELRDADLGHYDGLAGVLAAKGSLQGTLQRIDVQGDSEIPNFRLTQSPNATSLLVAYHVLVNALTGETTLDSVRAQFARTTVTARGDVKPEHGTTVSVDFHSAAARVEDLLRMFGQSPLPALNGPITFRAHTVLPPGHERFLRKLRLDGSFGIDDARFTRARTQERVDELSARARGKGKQVNDGMEPARVVSDLTGRVVMRNGVARLSAVSFRVPGAYARGQGTYNLLNKRVNLTGMLTMESDLPQTTSGIKSLLLRPLSWFADKKKGKGSRVPVRVSGTYPNPKFQMSLTGRK